MARLTLADLSSPEVELPGGHVYTVKPATRAVVAKGEEVEKRLEATADDNLDGIVAVYGEMLDLRLESAETGQPRPSTIVGRLWKGDKVTLPQLQGLLRSIAETDRPT
jgi:hypothetical protein